MVSCVLLSACAGPAPTPAPPPPPPVPVYTTSFVCADGNTPVQNAVCGSPALAGLDVQMAGLYRQHLGDDSIFERDQVLASQRAWLLGLQGACGTAQPCLAAAYQARIATLAGWSVTPPGPARAINKYVQYKLLDARQPAICEALAGAPLAADGAIDPGQLAGAREIAGTHGPAASGNITVDLYRAGLYAGYQNRARGVSVGGRQVLNSNSVGSYVETLPNGGGRFVVYASQTGDYGSIDVARYHGQTLALVTDVIGYNSPAPPGEAAVAAVFTLGQSAAPDCLFEAYITPPPLSLGVFSEQPNLTPFLGLIDSLEATPPAGLAPSDLADSAYLAAETRWMLLNMPLVVLEAERRGGWTGWLRARHDQVLDALFAWSRQSPANLAAFNRLFALLRPAAVDLDTIYVQQQGLSAADAAQATAIAMMELLYQASLNISPGLGAGPVDPAQFVHYRPRYPILATPQ